MKQLRLLFLLVFPSAFFPLPSSFAADTSPFGSRSSSLGGSSVSLYDVWSVRNNQAGLGWMKKMAGGITYQDQFLMNELSTKAVGLAIPVKGGTLGVCASQFGYSLYSENRIGLAFGRSFGKKIAAGVSMDYFGTEISEYGKKTSLVAEAGIQARPIKNLTLGVHLFNLTRTKLADYNDERIPTIMRLGFNYRFSEKVMLVMEAEKDMEKKAMAKAGIEYQPTSAFYLRAGIATNPSLSCFGFGINIRNFKLDLSSSYHSTLGFTPQMGLIYTFEKIATRDIQ